MIDNNMVPARQYQKAWRMGDVKFYSLLRDPSFPSVRIGNTFYILKDNWRFGWKSNPAKIKARNDSRCGLNTLPGRR